MQFIPSDIEDEVLLVPREGHFYVLILCSSIFSDLDGLDLFVEHEVVDPEV